MKRLLTFIWFFAWILGAAAQETVIWASEVVDVSSEYTPLEYSATQALHKPNVLPAGGDNPNAWRPKADNKEDFIMVSFDKPIRARQVAIAESENPGAVTRVYAYDAEYREYTLFELSPRTIPLESRLLNLFFETTPYEIHALKVFIDGAAVPGFNALDAIGLSASNIPINVLINLVAGVAHDAPATRINESVNSQYIEHSPVISPDGRHLYFSRRYHPGNVGGENDVEDIWVSDRDLETGQWLPARNLGPPLNTEGPNFVSAITLVDGKEVMILGNRYGKKGRMYSGVSIARKDENGEYTQPEAVEIEKDYNYSPKVDYFLAPEGNALIMSAEREDSYGGRDLYVCFKKGDVWTEPKNLGNEVNTASDDFAPFLGQDGKTLYYSTSGFSGYGGADIHVAFRLDDSWVKWSIPENLGSSLNSPNDDQYFSIPSTGQHVYFSRGKVDEDTDIYSFKADDIFIDKESKLMPSIGHLISRDEPEYFVTIRGEVLESRMERPIKGATVMIERLPDGIDVGSVTSGENGEYEITVRAGARYGLVAMEDGYLSTGEHFDFNELKNNDTLKVYLFLSKIQKGTRIVINNIFFDFNKTVLKTSSYSELNRILRLLTSGQIRRIEISGYTDSVGDADYNRKLSERRAQAIADFFINSGVAAERMKVTGYGEERPRVANNTPENMAKNRRVEVTVIE